MGKVNGMKEKLHYPIYDAFFVPGAAEEGKVGTGFMEAMGGDRQRLRFFTDVQNKTRLETNLQAANVLPSMNSLEIRALRVVISLDRVTRKQRASGITEAQLLERLIYSSVTSLLVGEKVAIEAPTFWFPSGTGISAATGNGADFGRPDPMATFRFAEPVFIEPQQNFRVEILFPRDVPADLQAICGPLWIWTVLDGYLTRDVQ